MPRPCIQVQSKSTPPWRVASRWQSCKGWGCHDGTRHAYPLSWRVVGIAQIRSTCRHPAQPHDPMPISKCHPQKCTWNGYAGQRMVAGQHARLGSGIPSEGPSPLLRIWHAPVGATCPCRLHPHPRPGLCLCLIGGDVQQLLNAIWQQLLWRTNRLGQKYGADGKGQAWKQQQQ